MADTVLHGIVTRRYKHFYVVEAGDEELLCALSSKLGKDLEYPEADSGSRRTRVERVGAVALVAPVVVGDEVTVERGDEESMIVEVAERRSVLSRRSPGRQHKEQFIAANVDLVLVVAATRTPDFRPDLLDRFLCGAEFQEIPAAICLNKTDLGVPDEVEGMLAAYPVLGYSVVRTSAESGEGLDALRGLLQARTSIAVGLSGVGKTSLINAVEPGLDLRVNPVNRRTGLGRHTTTNSELVRFSFGGHIVDAPGVRELDIWDAEPEDVPFLFPEFRPHQGQCRFGNTCRHDREPGCSVRAAVDEGSIAAHRYRSYLAIRKELERRETRY